MPPTQTSPLRPSRLPLNQVTHFYRGGERIAAWRRDERAGGPNRPEEWIGSMTTMTSPEDDPSGKGLSRLADGTLLRDAVLADPERWLGPAHVAAYGASTEILVKLLDAGQRLPVHLHPDRAFARRHLGLRHGKTEAWVVLGVDGDAKVRLGFAEPMAPARLRAMVDGRDTAGLVASLRARSVRPGDAVLVPAGTPHCLDEGVFVLELQEPTDLSILLEPGGFGGEIRADLGLGLDLALRAVRHEALGADELAELVVPRERVAAAEPGRPVPLLPPAAAPFFRAHLLRGGHGAVIEPGFAIVVATRGAGTLVTEAGGELALRRGDTAIVPYAAGEWRLRDDGTGGDAPGNDLPGNDVPGNDAGHGPRAETDDTGDGEATVVVCRPPAA